VHIRRYLQSAEALGYSLVDWEREAIVRAAEMPDSVLRAQTDARGDVAWSTRPFPDLGRSLTVALSHVTRDTSNPLLQFKNTNRLLYDEATEEAQTLGVDHVLIRSLSDRVTETSIHTLLFQVDGRWWTPPLSDGLLAGIVRRELLRRGVVDERSLPTEEARRRPPIALCNAVVGVVSARWATG
jgi:branched-subunit amino acid aminotransferase/4-amino-4-deoxychorismate lyase